MALGIVANTAVFRVVGGVVLNGGVRMLMRRSGLNPGVDSAQLLVPLLMNRQKPAYAAGRRVLV